MAGTAKADPRNHRDAPTSIMLPGVVLGVGLGGFVDGIVLHQILQWHHMISSSDTANIDIGSYPVTTVPGLQMNTLWDGIFHAVTWLAVLTGPGILYSRITGSRGRIWTSRVLWGWILVGFGIFNIVEGLLNHHILGVHHVISGEYQTLADILFLISGVLLIGGGWLLQRSAPAVDLAAAERSAAAGS
ncbi:DUF2243 domain-containing protein [Arthrobacter sp. KFRI-F3372]|uniref:DUF2243 domain-containing protein n=1 Tax=Micrococcaceae TaxID=1268 RepID=UPI00278A2FF3|nr:MULTISPECIES: DUF2243 domain-containing protein [Micrococcaceae]MDP9988369.1 putative membrane protein [Arthrobacter oryzae]MEE2523867.1 DUF2243 domain-containing protein [Pseudarthrobacter sp. J47]MEE2530297.1 DUF2243 domain-containing protein [Pseudarthrobacter sp. J75]WHP61036.1 DUF2243 domain-containing protein [Arthrobacter sp. KFRI-F3372]